jgi:hypothetical protein
MTTPATRNVQESMTEGTLCVAFEGVCSGYV